jgi:hypothetical protein
MPRTPNAVPIYRRHKPTDQAVCTVRLPGGGSKQFYLGRYKSAASRAEYERVVALVSANGGVYPTAGQDVTVSEALLVFVQFAERHYRNQDGRPTGTAEDLKITLGYVTSAGCSAGPYCPTSASLNSRPCGTRWSGTAGSAPRSISG